LNNTISGNNISGANSMSYDGAGVYTFNAGSNSIHSNTIRDCGSKYLRSAGVMVDVESGGSTLAMSITDNTITGNSTAGIAVSGSGHKITGNTLEGNGEDFMDGRGQLQFFASGSSASNCTVTGNTVTASTNRHFLVAEGGSTSGHYFNCNSYCGTAEKQFSWAGEWMDFATWQQKTGHDSRSVLNGATPCRILYFIPAMITGGSSE